MLVTTMIYFYMEHHVDSLQSDYTVGLVTGKTSRL